MHRHQRLILVVLAVLMVGAGIGVPLGKYLTRVPVDGGPSRPVAYQILYSTSSSATPSKTTSGWELLTVDRPFQASDLDYSRRPGPGATPTGGSAFTVDRLYAYAAGGLQPVSGRQPGPPGYDQDLMTQMPGLLSRDLARKLGSTETLAGRRCQVYRFSEPPDGAVTKLSGTKEHDDLCLDSSGLELGETWTLGGRVVEVRRAVRVTVGLVRSPVSPTSSALPSDAAGTASPDRHPQTFLPTPPTPAGFHALEPESFVEPGPEGEEQDAAAEIVWAFAKGPDVVTVEAGTSGSGQLPWADEPTVTEPVHLTGLGSGESALRSDGAEIRIDEGDGQWIRIRGSVPLKGLIAYASTLSPPA